MTCQRKTCGDAVPFLAQKPGSLKCPECKAKLPAQIAQEAEQLMVKSEAVIKKMEECADQGDFASIIRLGEQIFQRASGLLHPKNFALCTMSLLCSSAFTSLRNFSMAFTFSQNALEGTTFSYPEKHVAVGSHLLQLIQLGLQLHVEEPSLYDDLELLGRNAINITGISAGQASATQRKALELYDQVVMERKAFGAGNSCDGCGNHHHH